MRILCLAAMLIPPWNVFWWVIGLVIYGISRLMDDDDSGDTFLTVVLGAPVSIPGFLFSTVWGWCTRSG